MNESQQATVQRQTLDVKQAAALIGVSTTSIYQLCREQKIPHIRVRARILFHRTVLEEWLRSGGVTV
ncbi:helix-turn-helix domain-containing protein [Paenibacillus sp. FSL M7-0420]|uniref:helix-turn-helix domain-containing protein n=1 Tax=Paenibacillus sp. FSL M7-0420 TaxID=2921609 RepID=UPI0030FAEB7F